MINRGRWLAWLPTHNTTAADFCVWQTNPISTRRASANLKYSAYDASHTNPLLLGLRMMVIKDVDCKIIVVNIVLIYLKRCRRVCEYYYSPPKGYPSLILVP